MSQFWQFVLLGLGTGALYALTAQGLVLIYRGSGVLNFAQGAVGMLGAFLYYRVGQAHHWPIGYSFLLALAVPAAVSALIHIGIMARLKRSSALTRLVATLGVFFLLVAVADRVWGVGTFPVRSPLPQRVLHPFARSITVGEDRLLILLIAFTATVVLSAAYRWTRFGQATEAVAENPRGASALGLSPDLIATATWAIGGIFAALAGIFIAPILFLQSSALALTVLRALAAGLIGRFRSFWLTFVGALGIGVVESLLSRFVQHSGVFKPITSKAGLLFGQFSAQSVSRSVAFLIIVVVLVVGGRALPLRSDVLDRLPVIGSGRVNWPMLGVGILAMSGLLLTVPVDWATALVVSLASVLILLSVVVVTGYVGQLSLAQVALAGFGVWVAGRLVQAQGWPFPLALLAGVLATVPLGVLVAIPALRTRGINLAVLTFGLSVCLTELILNNSTLTGGLGGTVVGSTRIFGIDVAAFNHPGRYGLLVLFFVVLAGLGVANLRRGRAGRRLIAVRGNERAAASLGISVYGAKLYAFGLGAAIAALGGILLGFVQQTIAYRQFGELQSVQVVVFAVIGGIGFVLGPLFGAVLVAGGLGARVALALGLKGSELDVISGALLLITILAHPDGLASTPGRLMRRVSRGRAPVRTRLPVADLSPRTLGQPQNLVVSELTVRFGGVLAVDRVSFEVRAGEILGLIGPNGAGKTTVIDAITGFVAATGQLTLGEQRIETWPASKRARHGLGRSFQSLELFDDLTVGENILAACDNRSPWLYLTDLIRPGVASFTPAAGAAIREFELEPDLDKMPSELSYGRRRLVAIARSVAAQPAVLLLDEPVAGLSEGESRELGGLVTRLAKERGLAVMIIEHDVSLVMGVCDQLVVLDFGKEIAAGPPAVIADNHLVKAAYLGEPDDELDALAASMGSETATDDELATLS